MTAPRPSSIPPLSATDRLALLLDDFRQAWHVAGGNPPDPAAFVPPPGDGLRVRAAAAVARADLRERVCRGLAADAGVYLVAFPELLSEPDEAVGVVAEQHALRERGCAAVDLAGLRARFPSLAARLDEWRRDRPAETPSNAAGRSWSAPPSPAPEFSELKTRTHHGCIREVELDRDFKYRLIEVLGRGAFGEVWQAIAPGGVPVAVKIITRPVSSRDAQQEMVSLELIRGLRHPYLTSIHAFWVKNDTLHIAMDLADSSLHKRLRECLDAGLPGIPADELLRYARQSAEAFDHLHSRNILHLDIKPANILLQKGYVKVADFGLAGLLEGGQSSMAVNHFSGTPGYTAPEVYSNRIHKHSDQYGFAMMYAELRLGRRLVNAKSVIQAMEAARTGAFDLDPLGPAEQRVLRRATAIDPYKRFDSCVEFADALRDAVARDAEPPPPPRRRPWAVAVAGALLLALVGALAAFRGWAEPVARVPMGCRPVGAEVVTDQLGVTYPRRVTRPGPAGQDIAFVLVPRLPGDAEDALIDTFYIAVDKITVEDFRRSGVAPAWEPPADAAGVRRPAFNVTWFQADAYARSVGGKLPTVKQWDKAAGRYSQGRSVGPYRGAAGKARVCVDTDAPVDVGTSEDDESVSGCRDMAGNGFEWTRNVSLTGEIMREQSASNKSLVLRGRQYTAERPLSFEDLERGSFAVCVAGRHRTNLGFRVVLEPRDED